MGIMPEVCTCRHARLHHKEHDSEQPGKCHPPKETDPKKCSCKKYVEDKDQLTAQEQITKSLDAIKKLTRAIKETDESLIKDFPRKGQAPK